MQKVPKGIPSQAIQLRPRPPLRRLAVVLVVFASYVYIFYLMLNKDVQWDSLHNPFRQAGTAVWFALALVLMPANWLLEAQKWRLLVGRLQQTRLGWALEIVWKSMSYAVFTPQRLGEIPARALHLEKAHQKAGGVLTFYGSLMQQGATLFFGLTGALYTSIHSYLSAPPLLWYSLLPVWGAAGFLAFWYFPELYKKIAGRFLKNSQGKPWQLPAITPKQKSHVFGLGLLRYVVFASQYVFMLWAAGLSLPYLVAFAYIAVIYLIMSLMPGFILSDLGIRGSVALFFLGTYTGAPAAVLSAALGIWLLNVATPTLIGGLLILRKNGGKR